MSLVEEPDLDRRRSDWAVDEWDEVGQVPAVEPLRRQTRIVKWVVWLAFVLATVLIIVAGYVGGRVIEALFHLLGECTLFSWRPFDAYFRLITARRNPCLIILTIATLCARADLGILGVAAWTCLSTAIMAAGNRAGFIVSLLTLAIVTSAVASTVSARRTCCCISRVAPATRESLTTDVSSSSNCAGAW